MSEGHDDNLPDDLSGFLLRRYGVAPGAPSQDDSLPDPNEVAAWVHGGLTPEARARFGRQMLSDPLLRDQVAFEQGHVGQEAASHRRAWTRRALAAAGVAAAALVLGIVLPLLGGEEPVTPSPTLAELVRAGQGESVIATLEASPELDAEGGRLLVLARYAAGQGDPLRGLDEALLPPGTGALLPLSVAEIGALDAEARVVVRNGRSGPGSQRVLRPRGLILAGRPATTVVPGRQPLELVVYRNRDQHTMFSRRIPAVPDEGNAVRLRYPDSAPALEAGVHYGAELRTLDGELVAHASFLRADEALVAQCRAQRELVDAVLPSGSLRQKALANFYVRHELFADALEALRGVPAEGQDASWRRLRRLANELLQR